MCRWRQPNRYWRFCPETYFDLSVRHFHEKLREEHSIKLSYTWLKQALQGAGLVARFACRRRARRPMPGMLLHIDGSKYRWFSDDRYHDRLVILDDATSELYYAQPVEEESTRTVMTGLRDRNDCRRNSASQASIRSSRPTRFCARVTLPNSIKFAKPAAEKGTVFRKCGRKDLDLAFSIQTERTVAEDNTVQMRNTHLQLDKLLSGTPQPHAPSRSTNTWMEGCRCAGERTC